jgi:RimJ/RimL family protein N-acetyltransferase
MARSDTRFFTEDWIITVLSHPHVRFIRLTPIHLDEHIERTSDPNNRPFSNPDDKIWSEERKEATKARHQERYTLSKTKHQALEFLVHIDGKLMGYGGVFEIPEVVVGFANLGLGLDPSLRGTRLGNAMMKVLLRLSNEIDASVISVGTMKANKPMRALATSLGFEEREEIVDIPGKGVIAEVVFSIDNAKWRAWKDYEINVEFKGPAP